MNPGWALLDFLNSGGWVLWIILALAVLQFALILERYWFFTLSWGFWSRLIVEEWQQRPEHGSRTAHQIRAALLSRARIQLEQYLPLLKTLVKVAPMLGLLGTVNGMIDVFQVMAVSGNHNFQALAAGVGSATWTTLAGMVVALVGFYFQARFRRLIEQRYHQLADGLLLDDQEGQSART